MWNVKFNILTYFAVLSIKCIIRNIIMRSTKKCIADMTTKSSFQNIHAGKHKLGFKTRVGINLMEFSRHREGPVIISKCKCFKSLIMMAFGIHSWHMALKRSRHVRRIHLCMFFLILFCLVFTRKFFSSFPLWSGLNLSVRVNVLQ